MGHMATSRSLYDILGIPQNATTDEVRKAYKLRALETHPDKLSPDASELERDAAQSHFREVHTAFQILGDVAKRRAYDNGLNFITARYAAAAEKQAALARERAAWLRKSEERYQERMRILREEIEASQRRYQAKMENVELQYQEKVHAMEEKLKEEREVERRVEEQVPETYTFQDEMLNELRRLNPVWETRRQEVLKRQAERLKRQPGVHV